MVHKQQISSFSTMLIGLVIATSVSMVPVNAIAERANSALKINVKVLEAYQAIHKPELTANNIAKSQAILPTNPSPIARPSITIAAKKPVITQQSKALPKLKPTTEPAATATATKPLEKITTGDINAADFLKEQNKQATISSPNVIPTPDFKKQQSVQPTQQKQTSKPAKKEAISKVDVDKKKPSNDKAALKTPDDIAIPPLEIIIDTPEVTITPTQEEAAIEQPKLTEKKATPEVVIDNKANLKEEKPVTIKEDSAAQRVKAIIDQQASTTKDNITDTNQENATNIAASLLSDQPFSILFNEENTHLTAEGKQHIQKLLNSIDAKETSGKLKIIGYAENMSNNQSLARRISLQRAIAVRNYIIQSGIERSLIGSVQAKGSQDSADNAIKNRVDIIISDDNSAS